MPEPRCSVVIPAYNCERYIAQAIESARAQTIGAEQVEIIVLDDGSTDGTARVASSFGRAVRFVQLDHGGVSRARNTGVALARAPVVAFLDADDYWMPHRLESALRLLDCEERVFVNTEYYVERDGVLSRDPYYKSRALRCLFQLSAPAQLTFALEDNFINSMVVAPKEALVLAGGFNANLRYGEDWDLWLRLLRSGYAARLVTAPSAVYRFGRPGATTTRHDASMARDRLWVLSQYRQSVSPYRWRRSAALARRLAVRQFVQRLIPIHS